MWGVTGVRISTYQTKGEIMREFIGGAFIFVGLLTIPAAIVGLISPAKLAKDGDPVPSRIRIGLSMLAGLLVLTAIGSIILPDKSSHEDAP